MAKRKPGRPKKKKSRKLSVMVLHRTRDTIELVSSIEAYKDRLAAAMAERFASGLRPGETLPDYLLTLELAARELKTALKRLIAIDDEVDAASVKRDLRRGERDVLAGKVLQPRAVSVRGAIDQAYGREEGRQLHGMKGQTRHRATLLLKQLRPLVIRLEATARELPRPSNPHAYVDRERWTRMLVPRYHELVKLDSEVVRLRDKVVPGLVLDKSRAMKSFDETYADLLRLVTSYFRMARFDLKLIQNLKPYYQRRRLNKLARDRRRARAAAADPAAGEQVEPARRPAREPARVAVSKTVMKWLEKNRLFGT
ncbi:MAG: hypothetical protein GY719_38540 [bacterium]|nr:hypothetical protein [bacterium]